MFRSLFGNKGDTAVANISATDLKQRLDAGEKLYLLDVRTDEEYRSDGRISGAKLLPLQMLSMRVAELPKDTPIVCICRSGSRSGIAADQLARQGFTGVLNLSGGMMAWARAGLPMKKG